MLPVYTHYLRPVDYGVLEILDLSISLWNVLNMGMTRALLRYLAPRKARRRKRQPSARDTSSPILSGGLLFCSARAGFANFHFILGPDFSPTCRLLSFATLILGFRRQPRPAPIFRALGASRAFVSWTSSASWHCSV